MNYIKSKNEKRSKKKEKMERKTRKMWQREKIIYKGHLINKENFALRVSNRKHCLQLYFFQRNL